MFVRLSFSMLLLGASMAIHAEDPAAVAASPTPAKALTPQQQALKTQLDTMAPLLVKTATQIAQMIDQNKVGEVWDNASNVAKTIAPRDAFIKQVTADRAEVGPLKSRELGGVSSAVSDGNARNGASTMPAGTYINVAFATRFGTNPQPVRELVSFHRDADQNWRVTGYTLR